MGSGDLPWDPPSLRQARGGMEPVQPQPPMALGSSEEKIALLVDHAPHCWGVLQVD